MTYRVKGIREETPDTFVEVSPELAAERGIEDGTYLELRSRHGFVKVRAIVSDRVQGKQLYMAMNTLEFPVNRVTSSNTDRATHTPAFKEAAVQMTIIGKRESPLPKQNFRYGHPTPQRGVEVERKWRQPGYTLPGQKLVHIETKPPLERREDTDSI